MIPDVKYGLLFISDAPDKYALTVYTNDITDDIIDSIDCCTRNICFHYYDRSNISINFNCSTVKWNNFIKNLHYIGFYGILTDRYLKFTASNLTNAKHLQTLYIGASSYSMFEDDKLEYLPKLNLIVNGFGLVQMSEIMKQWTISLGSHYKHYC